MSKLVCPDCGSSDVDERVWVNVNTRKENDNTHLAFCNDCNRSMPSNGLELKEPNFNSITYKIK